MVHWVCGPNLHLMVYVTASHFFVKLFRVVLSKLVECSEAKPLVSRGKSFRWLWFQRLQNYLLSVQMVSSHLPPYLFLFSFFLLISFYLFYFFLYSSLFPIFSLGICRFPQLEIGYMSVCHTFYLDFVEHLSQVITGALKSQQRKHVCALTPSAFIS